MPPQSLGDRGGEEGERGGSGDFVLSANEIPWEGKCAFMASMIVLITEYRYGLTVLTEVI